MLQFYLLLSLNLLWFGNANCFTYVKNYLLSLVFVFYPNVLLRHYKKEREREREKHSLTE